MWCRSWAHRLLHLAKQVGRQQDLAERLFAATFTEGHALGARGVPFFVFDGV